LTINHLFGQKRNKKKRGVSKLPQVEKGLKQAIHQSVKKGREGTVVVPLKHKKSASFYSVIT